MPLSRWAAWRSSRTKRTRVRYWIGASHLRGGRARWMRSARSLQRYHLGGLHLQGLQKTQPSRKSLSRKMTRKTPNLWPAASVPPQPEMWQAPRNPHLSLTSAPRPLPTKTLRMLSSRVRKARNQSHSCTRRSPGGLQAASPPGPSSARRQLSLRRRQRSKSVRSRQQRDPMSSSASMPSSSTWRERMLSTRTTLVHS